MGLVNGTKWKKLRKEFDPEFLRRSVLKETPNIDEDARKFVSEMMPADTKLLTVPAATAVSRFPFFCTAEYLYGSLCDEEKESLWTIGQQSLRMMGYVLSGGLFRLSISQIINQAATQDLNEFEARWSEFNDRIYQSRKDMSPQPPIVALWRLVLDGDLATRDVCIPSTHWTLRSSPANTDMRGRSCTPSAKFFLRI